MKTSLTVHAQRFFADHLKRAKWTPGLFYAFALLVISGPFVPLAKAEFIITETMQYDAPGNDLRALSDVDKDECVDRCKADRKCRALYWVDHKCFLKKRFDGEVVEKKFEDGVFIHVQEYRRIQNQDAKGNDIKSFTDTIEGGCQMFCSTMYADSCAAYYWVNNTCFLKDSVGELRDKDFEPGVFGIRLR